ncbi:MAG: acetylglutamate kinase [Thermoplasmata archaeon]
MSESSNPKIVTVKLGGSTMDDEGVIHRLAEDVRYLQKSSLRFVIVHGGGKEITRRMSDAGIETKKVSGLRITDEATMEIVEQVMREINKDICRIFEASGLIPEPAIGSDGLLICEKKPPVKVGNGLSESLVDLGRVGSVVKVESGIILDAIGRGHVPIIAPLGKDASGKTLNINADTAAGSIAGACSEEFVLMTDVDGILLADSEGMRVVSELRASEIPILIEKGIITEGMLPKVEACLHALKSGVRTARIVNGTRQHALKSAFEDGAVGTKILR